MRYLPLTLLLTTLHSAYSYGQQQKNIDSATASITKVPLKFINDANAKIEKYSNRITSKTEKTLSKLAKWEDKIHSLLLKASPETAQQLFGEGSMSFATMLQKIQEGKALVENQKAKYDEYRDKLVTNIKYIESEKQQLNNNYIVPLQKAKAATKQLETSVSETEAAETLIKERKKQLLTAAYKALGKSKYLTKINKEAYYYVETLKNYKELFNDESKFEQTAISLLKKIPGFEKFASENSMLSGLFGNFSLQGGANGASIPIVNGLSSRGQIMQSLQGAGIGGSSGGFNPFDNISQQLPDVKSRFTNLLGGSGGADEPLPDFKPNTQKTKSFFKRLEYATDIQFGSAVNYIPSTSNIALQIGYKLNDKFSFGGGMSYILGLGKGWDNIKLSSEGIGFRTYVKMGMKKGISVQGGSEWNYNVHFSKIGDLGSSPNWQQKALIGIGKSIKAGKKLKSDVKLLYDFMYNNHKPATQPFIFRIGYHF